MLFTVLQKETHYCSLLGSKYLEISLCQHPIHFFFFDTEQLSLVHSDYIHSDSSSNMPIYVLDHFLNESKDATMPWKDDITIASLHLHRDKNYKYCMRKIHRYMGTGTPESLFENTLKFVRLSFFLDKSCTYIWP
jgi:hypothetical protein